MKRLIEATNEGLEAYLGKEVTLFCCIYIYTGVLSAVNETDIELTDPKLIYETGELNSGEWKDAQVLPSPWYIRTTSIESWGNAKC